MRIEYWLVAMAMAAFGTIGCNEAEYQNYSKAPLSEGHDHDHDHDHGEVGKHGGHVLELDDAHACHAELVFDATTRDITVYFYGAEVGVAKVATAVALELHDGDSHKELVSKPMPLDGETEEASSRWVIRGTDLPAAITSEEQLDGHLAATLDGKPFSYALEPHSHGDHEHEHDDSDHDHEKPETGAK